MEAGSYVIRGDAAERFSAVCVARIDLEIAKGMIERCLEKLDSEKESHLEEAFWTTGLIRFRRAFSKGRKVDWGHGNVLSNLGPENRASYDRFYLLADKFIAHPVGIGEDMTATAELGPGEDGSVIVYAGAVRLRRVFSPGADLADEFLSLLAKLVSLVAEHEDKTHQEYLREIRTWSPTELLKGGRYEEAVHFDETSALYRRESKKSYGRTKS